MSRDCTTARINRLELLDLLDASAAPERQMVTIRMPALRVQDLNRRVEISMLPVPATIARTPDVHAGSDVTLIGLICTVSMAICGALAWFG